MAVLIVTNADSSGTGSLADAVAKANATTVADKIVFAKELAGQTIALTGELVLTNKVTINGDTNKDGDGDITIDLSTVGRITNSAGNVATLESLAISNGAKPSDDLSGGQVASAVTNRGNLTLSYVSVSSSLVYSFSASGGGANAATLVNTGTLQVRQSAFTGNSNTGGPAMTGKWIMAVEVAARAPS